MSNATERDGEGRFPGTTGIRVAVWAFALVLGLWAWWRWWVFDYGTFDLAFYVQALWLTLRGEGVTTLLDISLMGNHAEPLVYLALPIFAVAPHPMTLVGLQTIALASMPFAAWGICRAKGVGGWPGQWLAVLPLLWPPVWFAGLHEFHPETLAAPLLLWAWRARVEGRWVAYAGWLVLVVGCKENVALLAGWMHLVLLIVERGRHWRWDIGVAALAWGWVLLYGLWLGPWWNAGKVAYGSLYAHLGAEAGGGGLWGGDRVVDQLWQALSEGSLGMGMLSLSGGLLLFRARWLVIAAPILAQHWLSWRSAEWDWHLHYAAPLVPLVWLAIVESLAEWNASVRKIWVLGLAGVAILAQGVNGPFGMLWPGGPEAVSKRLAEAEIKRQMLARVPDDASVTATYNLLAHLATREELRSLHLVLKGLQVLGKEAWQPPPATDWVLIDYLDGGTFDPVAGLYHPKLLGRDGRVTESSDRLLRTFLAGTNWTAEAKNGMAVLQRAGAVWRTEEEDPGGPEVMGLRLQSIRANWERTSGGVLQLEIDLIWDAVADRDSLSWMVLVIRTPTEAFTQVAGINVPWLGAGETGAERWAWELENVPPGRIEIELDFYDRLSRPGYPWRDPAVFGQKQAGWRVAEIPEE